MKHLDTLMKKMLMFAAAAVAVTVGCQKFKGQVGDDPDPLDDGRPVQIAFNSNVVNVDTKASLTGLNDSHDLYIYGLNRTKPGVGEIINAKAHMAKPVGAEDGWAATNGSLTFADNKVFFYNATKDRYDFYGYYIANAAEVPEKLTNYQIDVTIDGTQDILLAAADPKKDILAPGVYTDQVTSTENVYSAWSTRRGVVPKLEFRHVLAKYEFEVQNKGTQRVVVQSIDVTSKTKGQLTVVNMPESTEGADDALVQGLVIDKDDVESSMRLRSESFLVGGALLDPAGDGEDDDVMVDGISLEGNMTAPILLQGEVMTFAGQENNVIIRLVQSGMNEGQYRQIRMPIDLDEVENLGTKTMEGYTYVVSIIIYSLEEIELDVALIGWNSGGNVVLDQEDKVNDPDSGYEDEIHTDTQI